MKKILLLTLAIVLMVGSLCGCLIYGRGEEACYVSAVDDGFFWGKVYAKTDLSSSDADIYLVEKSNRELRDNLMKAAEQKQRVKIKYKKHWATATMDKDGTNDEILSFEVLAKEAK